MAIHVRTVPLRYPSSRTSTTTLASMATALRSRGSGSERMAGCVVTVKRREERA